jgi:hypothetical protein
LCYYIQDGMLSGIVDMQSYESLELSKDEKWKWCIKESEGWGMGGPNGNSWLEHNGCHKGVGWRDGASLSVNTYLWSMKFWGGWI